MVTNYKSPLMSRHHIYTIVTIHYDITIQSSNIVSSLDSQRVVTLTKPLEPLQPRSRFWIDENYFDHLIELKKDP